MTKQPEDHKLLYDVCQEILRLEKVNAELLGSLKLIQHNVKLAQISGNDWRIELALIQNITRSAIAKAERESNVTGGSDE